MLGRGKPKADRNGAKGGETDKIRDRLDEGESVVMWVRQSRIKPGSVGGINPNSIFVTEKRVIIRSPVTFGLGEHIEEYFYHQITNVRLEKGVMSASLIFYIPGMTELSKGGRQFLWRKGDRGTIDAIPKKDAERIYDYVRGKIRDAKDPVKPQEAAGKPKSTDELLAIIRERYARGEITREELMTMTKDLTGQ